jgi:hypothetical protein
MKICLICTQGISTGECYEVVAGNNCGDKRFRRERCKGFLCPTCLQGAIKNPSVCPACAGRYPHSNLDWATHHPQAKENHNAH